MFNEFTVFYWKLYNFLIHFFLNFLPFKTYQICYFYTVMPALKNGKAGKTEKYSKLFSKTSKYSLVVVIVIVCGCQKFRRYSLPSSPKVRLHLTQQKHSGCQFLSRAVTIFYVKRKPEIMKPFNVNKRYQRMRLRLNDSRSGWVYCSERSGGRRVWSSQTRSTADRPSRRSCGCPVQSRTPCRQSALGATPSPELSPPAKTSNK